MTSRVAFRKTLLIFSSQNVTLPGLVHWLLLMHSWLAWRVERHLLVTGVTVQVDVDDGKGEGEGGHNFYD